MSTSANEKAGQSGQKAENAGVSIFSQGGATGKTTVISMGNTST